MHRGGEINRPSRHWCPLGDPDDCSFHFYDQQWICDYNVIPTGIKYIPNTCETQPNAMY